jgi:hypothetical protein
MKELISMDTRSRLDEDYGRVPDNFATDREKRLLRYVDILRAEQIGASATVSAEGGRTGFGRWCSPGVLGTVVVVLTGLTLLLQTLGPPHAHRDSPPASAITTALVPPAPQPALPELPPVLQSAQSQPSEDGTATAAAPAGPDSQTSNPLPSSRDADPSGPVLAERRMADPPDAAPADIAPTAAPSEMPPTAAAARQDSAEPPVLQHEAGVAAALSPAGATAVVPEPEIAGPALWIYYSAGSSLAGQTARSLAARIGADVTSSDFAAQTDLPKAAVIRFSEERNHTLARTIGKSLGASGYRWKIENLSATSAGSQRNMIEVWLPTR